MSAAIATPSRTARDALGRAALYAFLARSLAYPTGPHRQALSADLVPLLRAARSADPDVDAALRAAIEASAASAEELLPAHRTLFPAVGQGELGLYETVYRTRDVFEESEILADIAGFYRAHGLVAGALERERPDHIAVELEFVAFLARKRAYAAVHLGRREVALCRESERAFLGAHLGAWAPLFGAALARLAPHPAYATLGVLIERWVTRDRPGDTLPLGADAATGHGERPPEPLEDECPLEVLG